MSTDEQLVFVLIYVLRVSVSMRITAYVQGVNEIMLTHPKLAVYIKAGYDLLN